MKTVLIAIILQAAAPATPAEPGKEPSSPTLQVMSSVSAEYDSREACANAAKGLSVLADAAGFGFVFSCTPKDLGKLEVEKPKPKPSPQRAPAAAPDGAST